MRQFGKLDERDGRSPKEERNLRADRRSPERAST